MFVKTCFLFALIGVTASLADAGEATVRTASQEEIRRFFAAEDKTVLTFVGYSGAGYQNEAAMLEAATEILKTRDPADTLVNIGVTPDGIGQVYPLAKRMGFTTTGIVSTQAKAYDADVSEALDYGFYVEDESWGGLIAGTETLSPTSHAMVENSDIVIAIGGGEVARDEFTAARDLGKTVTFIPADMNHDKAIAKAQKKGLPTPTDFRGAAHHALATDRD